MKIVLCSPSYKRPYVETLEYLPFCKVYVDEMEAPQYRAQNPEGANIVACPQGVQGNVSRIRNYILDQEFKDGADCVVIVDDDMKSIGRFENGEDIMLNPDEFFDFAEKYTIMCRDLWAYEWGMNLNNDKKCYREYSPFSTTAPILWPFQAFIDNAGGLRYDESLPLKEDYDMSIQQLNKYRKTLRLNMYHYNCKQSVNKGGCATYRNIEREMQQLNALKRKWGEKIVKEDTASNKKDRKHKDYNPQIHIPIRWI